MGVEALLGGAGPLLGSIEALAALGAVLRLRLDGSRVDPELAARLDGVLDALGLRDAVEALDAGEVGSVLSLIEGSLAQAAKLVSEPRAGWEQGDRAVVVAQGNTSALLAGVFASVVVPALGGDLDGRLTGGDGSFLDVGVGVGALSIAMCRVWPGLAVVGIDPWEPALELAAEQVAAAGLGERIELRRIAVEELEDSAAHDLAWVPTFFIAGTGLDVAIERVLAALRPGGCAILGLYARPADPVGAAVTDLRTVRHGGAVVAPEKVAGLMGEAGFADVDVLVDPERPGPLVFVVGRRPTL